MSQPSTTLRLRVAAHVHSSWSYDASWSLDRLARAFRRRGYDAVLMAEHDNGFDQARWEDYRAACERASRPDLLLVPGIEYGDTDNAVHIPVWGDVPFLGSGRTTIDVLERAHGSGGFTVFAHPGRRQAWQRYDQAWLPYLSALETWNRKYDGWAPGADASRLSESAGLEGVVSLDFHTRRQFFPLGMRLDVEGAVPTVASVHAALIRGSFTRMLSRLPLESVPTQVFSALEVAERLRRRGSQMKSGVPILSRGVTGRRSASSDSVRGDPGDGHGF